VHFDRYDTSNFLHGGECGINVYAVVMMSACAASEPVGNCQASWPWLFGVTRVTAVGFCC
jgi:hypothetical protein